MAAAALAPIISAAAQQTSDITGGFVNGLWNLYNENSAKEQQNLQAIYNQNLMTWQNYLNSIAADQSFEHQKQLLDMQARFSSPAHLLAEARKAGINPNVLFGKGASASAGSAPSSQVPQTGLAGVNAVAGGAQFPFAPHGVSEIAKAVESLAVADKMGIETDQIKKTINSIVSQEQSKAALMEINAQLASKFGDQKAQMEILQLYASAYQSIEAGNKDGAEKALLVAKEATEKEIAKMKGFEAKSAQIIADNMQAKCQAEIDNIKSGSEKNRAEAQKAVQEGRNFEASAIFKEFENKVRDSVGVSTFASREVSETEQAKIKTIYDKFDLDKQEALLDYLIEKARFEVESTDPLKGAFWVSVVKSILGPVAGAAVLKAAKRGK